MKSETKGLISQLFSLAQNGLRWCQILYQVTTKYFPERPIFFYYMLLGGISKHDMKIEYIMY